VLIGGVMGKNVGATLRSISQRQLAQALLINADFFSLARVAQKLNESCF
jgi:hypothetical protein